jgi:hypothetical protein
VSVGQSARAGCTSSSERGQPNAQLPIVQEGSMPFHFTSTRGLAYLAEFQQRQV